MHEIHAILAPLQYVNILMYYPSSHYVKVLVRLHIESVPKCYGVISGGNYRMMSYDDRRPVRSTDFLRPNETLVSNWYSGVGHLFFLGFTESAQVRLMVYVVTKWFIRVV